MWIPNNHYPLIRWVFLLVSCLPLATLVYGFLDNQLAPNSFARLSHTLGHTALVFLVLALAVTPLRRWAIFFFRFTPFKWGKRLADWNFLVRLRRSIGLLAFVYMTLHIYTYLYLELGFDWHEFVYEITTRQFLLPALAASIIMTILAITSANYFRRTLGRWWRRLHRLIYILSILAVLHYYMFAKVTDKLPIVYALVVGILLLHRLVLAAFKSLGRTDDTGMEATREDKR